MNTASKVLLLTLLFAAPAFAQNVRVDNVTFSSVQGFPFLPGATITICTAAATGLPCSPTVTGTCLSISDTTCNQPATQTSDALGNYGFWIQPGSYSYTVTKAGFGGFGPKPLTLACQPTASCTITGPQTINSNLTVSGTGTLANTNGDIAVDGVTNTTIAQAITKISATNGGKIYVPTTVTTSGGFTVPPFGNITFQPGNNTIAFTGPIVMSHGSTLDCARGVNLSSTTQVTTPNGGTVLDFSGAALSSSTDAISSAASGTMPTGIKISGCTIKVNNQNQTNGRDGIHLSAASNNHIDGVTIIRPGRHCISGDSGTAAFGDHLYDTYFQEVVCVHPGINSWGFNFETDLGGGGNGNDIDRIHCIDCKVHIDPCCTAATITNFSITNNVVTFIANNTFTVGDTVEITGLSTGTYLNAQFLKITAASGTQFSANFTNANVGSTADSGSASLNVWKGCFNFQVGTGANNAIADVYVQGHCLGMQWGGDGIALTKTSGSAFFSNMNFAGLMEEVLVPTNPNWGLFIADTAPADILGLTYLGSLVNIGAVGTAAITNFTISGNVVTFLATNSFSVGVPVWIWGLSTGTYLNAQLLTVTSATGSQFTANFTHANVSSTPDTGFAGAGGPHNVNLGVNNALGPIITVGTPNAEPDAWSFQFRSPNAPISIAGRPTLPGPVWASRAGGSYQFTINDSGQLFYNKMQGGNCTGGSTINCFLFDPNGFFGPGQDGVQSLGNPNGFLNFLGTHAYSSFLRETTAPTALSGNDTCYGDSTAHALKCNYNNTIPAAATFANVPLVIASGTSTLTANATLGAATCQAAITTSATNVAATDSIEWSFATAPATGDAISPVASYVTANNVNFARCNPTAASQAVTAIVINWRVLR